MTYNRPILPGPGDPPTLPNGSLFYNWQLPSVAALPDSEPKPSQRPQRDALLPISGNVQSRGRQKPTASDSTDWGALFGRQQTSQKREKSPKKRYKTEQDSNVQLPAKRQRSGPKTKPVGERKLVQPPKTTKRYYTTSREKKLQVINWIVDRSSWVVDSNPGVKVRQGLQMEGNWRPPNSKEVAAKWGIPERTVDRWWLSRYDILASPTGSRQCDSKQTSCFWPALEEKLYEEFSLHRSKNELVSTGWFIRTARRIFREIYAVDFDFAFTNGWFEGFKKRWGIRRRRLTNVAQKLPEDQLNVINSFLRFIRRQSTLPDGSNRYPAAVILNLDETPIPFEFLEGYTYDHAGAKTVSGKSLRSGWGKRQATLILYIFADGSKPIKPKIIYHGSQNGNLLKQEQAWYCPGVTIEFNEKAYNNEELFIRWLKDEFLPLRSEVDRDFLLVLDQASFHRTQKVLNLLRQNSTIPAIVPSGCTPLVQPLDTAVNKAFKDRLRYWIDELTSREATQEGLTSLEHWPIWRRRRLLTWAVGHSWDDLDPDLVIKSFRQCGISLPVDGSADTELKIKDLDQASFAGWELDTGDFEKQLEAIDIAEVEPEENVEYIKIDE